MELLLGLNKWNVEIAAESAWRFGIWDTFCNFLLEFFNSMQFRTMDGLGKDMAALMKMLKQKPKSFFPSGYALGSYHLKWLCRSLALVLAVKFQILQLWTMSCSFFDLPCSHRIEGKLRS